MQRIDKGMSEVLKADVRVIASSKNWIESEAVEQLRAAARLEGMRTAIGYPDLHPGKGSPVGAAFVTREVIYPYLIGNDIGCGMAFFQTDLLRRKAKVDRWMERLDGLEREWEGNTAERLEAAGVRRSPFDAALGTIGGGNHFAELQGVDEVREREDFAGLGLDKDHLFVLVHSGSRGLGESILRGYVEKHAAGGVAAESEDGAKYLESHDEAVRWARANRELIAARFMEALGGEPALVWDGCHNSMTRKGEAAWLHRKGAAPAESGMAVIPGSRGTLSYLVKVLGDPAEFGWSLAHGAGRKWSRSETRGRIRDRYEVSELVQTPLGGRVICENRELLYEEAPEAYKKIEVVVQDLVEAGMVRVVATLRPMITYKTRAVKR